MSPLYIVGVAILSAYWVYAAAWLMKSDYLIAKTKDEEHWTWVDIFFEFFFSLVLGPILFLFVRSECLKEEQENGVFRAHRVPRGDPMMFMAFLFRDTSDLKRVRRDRRIRELESEDVV